MKVGKRGLELHLPLITPCPSHLRRCHVSLPLASAASRPASPRHHERVHRIQADALKAYRLQLRAHAPTRARATFIANNALPVPPAPLPCLPPFAIGRLSARFPTPSCSRPLKSGGRFECISTAASRARSCNFRRGRCCATLRCL